MLYEIFYFLLIGLFAGVLAGLFGVGGGFIFIPAQLFIYSYFDIPKDLQVKFAIGTSLAAVVFSTIASSYAHHVRSAIYFPIIKKIVIGIVLGAILGSFLTKILPAQALEVVFGGFECLFGVYFVLSPHISDHSNMKSINILTLNALTILTSALSVILGVGGGIFLVPILSLLHLPLRKAIGSSSVATLIVAFLGSVSMLIPSFWLTTTYGAFGYLYFPAFVPMALGAVLAAPLGVKLTHSLPTARLKKCFGFLLIILGLIILMR